MSERCAVCDRPDGGIFHRPPNECIYETCEYDEAAADAGVPTGSLRYPHPTPHHTFRTEETNANT